MVLYLHDLSLAPPLRCLGSALVALALGGRLQLFGWSPDRSKLWIMLAVAAVAFIGTLRRKRKSLAKLVAPQTQDPKLYMSTLGLARMIRRREVSVVEVRSILDPNSLNSLTLSPMTTRGGRPIHTTVRGLQPAPQRDGRSTFQSRETGGSRGGPSPLDGF